MTMIVHTAMGAPIVPKIRVKLGFFAKMANILVQASRRSREAQNLSQAPDAILKDAGLARFKVNGKTYLYPHRD